MQHIDFQSTYSQLQDLQELMFGVTDEKPSDLNFSSEIRIGIF